MRKADTRKVKFVKEDTLIVAIDVGMEMNHGYCTTPDGKEAVLIAPSYTFITFIGKKHQ